MDDLFEAVECAEPCSRCKKPLGPKRMAALGRRFHETCWVCNMCEKPLDEYFVRADQPYCRDCKGKWDEQNAAKEDAAGAAAPAAGGAAANNKPIIPCGVCAKNIVGAKVTALGQKFHPE